MSKQMQNINEQMNTEHIWTKWIMKTMNNGTNEYRRQCAERSQQDWDHLFKIKCQHDWQTGYIKQSVQWMQCVGQK